MFNGEEKKNNLGRISEAFYIFRPIWFCLGMFNRVRLRLYWRWTVASGEVNGEE